MAAMDKVLNFNESCKRKGTVSPEGLRKNDQAKHLSSGCNTPRVRQCPINKLINKNARVTEHKTAKNLFAPISNKLF
jgi:hypothetical protein